MHILTMKKGGKMKKKLLESLFFIVLIGLIILTYTLTKNDKKKENKTIKIAEVTHSAFYTPLYVSIEKGFFKEENLEIELLLTPGADKVASAVLSGDVEVGFAGPESAIYVYKGEEKDYLVTFAGLTKKDGQFIIGRKSTFNWKDLEGKEVLVGRKGGMPALNFLRAMKNAGVDISKVNLNYSIDFASLSGAFIGNTGDYVNVFEPNATMLEKENYGHIVASIGTLSGEMPYTAFYTKKSYLENNQEIIHKFRNAINKGIQYTKEHSSKELASIIIKQFPNTNQSDLEKYIDNYKKNDSWLENTIIKEEIYKNLQDLMIENNLLDTYVPYDQLINNE